MECYRYGYTESLLTEGGFLSVNHTNTAGIEGRKKNTLHCDRKFEIGFVEDTT